MTNNAPLEVYGKEPISPLVKAVSKPVSLRHMPLKQTATQKRRSLKKKAP
jgi:hypothetical protein